MQKTLREIADLVGGVVEGDASVLITGVAGIKDAGPGDVTFVGNPKYLPLLATTKASAIIVDSNVPPCEKNLVRTDQPYISFTQILEMFATKFPVPKGIHPSAVVGEDVFLGEDVALHGGVVVEEGCRIGDRSVLYPGVCIGQDVEIGSDCTIYSRVVVCQNALIGNNVIIHSGTVIGSRPSPSSASKGIGLEAPEGTVIVEDDVEVGANVTIDSSRTGTTVIGRGTKIDNLVYIGSDASVGANCIIISQASVGSESTLGNGVTVAGQAGVLDGVKIGDGTIIAARAGVTEDVEPNRIISGFPAISHEKWLRICASMKRLPTIVREVREFKRHFQETEEAKRDQTEDN